ncbi:MAG: hypothetical protein HY897_08870 [Deltaproteobacteria bacterium]|nr:hypothetical protein [Deltaproteobacteria bacterium]
METAFGIGLRESGLRKACAALCLLLSCSDSRLYHTTRGPAEADRLALAGEVCTEDPADARFPVRVVLAVDQAQGPLFSAFDPAGDRVKLLGAFVQSALNSPEVAIAVVGYHGRAQKLAPLAGNFTRNHGELLGALNMLSIAQPCAQEGVCRDYREGLRSARALCEGDLASLPRGLAVLTQYVVILVNAGQHSPLAVATDCCEPGETECLEQDPLPSPDCQSEIQAAETADFEGALMAGGAGGFKLHVLHLAAETDPDLNAEVEAGMRRLAFSGKGVYGRADNIAGLSPASLDLLDLRTVLRAKQIVVSNVNVKPSAGGPAPDSDADGLSDVEETRFGTSPTDADTDHDGASDFVEALTGSDPLVAALPPACVSLANPAADTDLDGLSDCDEVLLGTDPSLPDTDGDGIPDRLEVSLATDYLHPDAALDTDGDGTSNGYEVRNHTDPRSSNAGAVSGFEYRYEISDKGLVDTATASRLAQLGGAVVSTVSAETTPGIGILRFAAAAGTMAWQDAGDPAPGPAVPVLSGGTFRLGSSSYAPAQGDGGRWISVSVTAGALPPVDIAEQVRIVFRQKHCLEFTVRNIKLLTTAAGPGGMEGLNNIIIYFAEAPEGRLDAPGPFRMAHITVRYVEPDLREPAGAVLDVGDEEFVRPEIAAQGAGGVP